MRIEDIDWVVLNLERSPEQLARFRQANDRHRLPIELVPATDGLEVNLRELTDLGLAMPEDIEEWDRDAIGSALSHWLCWYQAVESGRPVGIFEDRALLRHDFPQRVTGLFGKLPPDWEMVQLGYNTDAVLDVQVSPVCRFRGVFSTKYTYGDPADFVNQREPVGPVRVFNAFGTFAYVVTPAGAQKLIDACFPLSTRTVSIPAMSIRLRATSLDALMNNVFSELQVYACLPPLAQPFPQPPLDGTKSAA